MGTFTKFNVTTSNARYSKNEEAQKRNTRPAGRQKLFSTIALVLSLGTGRRRRWRVARNYSMHSGRLLRRARDDALQSRFPVHFALLLRYNSRECCSGLASSALALALSVWCGHERKYDYALGARAFCRAIYLLAGIFFSWGEKSSSGDFWRFGGVSFDEGLNVEPISFFVWLLTILDEGVIRFLIDEATSVTRADTFS